MTEKIDPWIEAITPERIKRALAGFPLELAEGWDMERLTREIRYFANLGRDMVRLGPERQSDVAAREELKELSNQANSLLVGLRAIGHTSGFALFVRAMLEEQAGADDTRYLGEEYDRDFLAPLRKISTLLSMAVEDLGRRPKQKPRWIQREARQMRVRFAVRSSALFEVAFDQIAKSDNWRVEYGDDRHPSADFFERIYGELFGTTEGLSVPRVMQAAARVRAGKLKDGDVATYSSFFHLRVGS